MRNATISNEFFEFINNKDCSDSFTNGSINFVTKSFLSYANRFFSIKVMGIFINLLCGLIIAIILFSKNELNRKTNKKKLY
jgi:hypothetical protein